MSYKIIGKYIRGLHMSKLYRRRPQTYVVHITVHTYRPIGIGPYGWAHRDRNTTFWTGNLGGKKAGGQISLTT